MERKRRDALFVIVVILLGLMIGCKKGVSKAEEEKIAIVARSQDELHVAWAERREDGKLVMVIDGKVDSIEYDNIGAIVFSGDGKRIAYTTKGGEKWSIVVDGVVNPGFRAFPGFEDINMSSLTFSPSSEHFAFGAQLGNRWFVVLDGVVMPQGGHDFVGYCTFSPDNEHFAYMARKGNKQCIVFDGKAGKEYNFVSEPIISPCGEHIAYVATDSNNLQCVVWDEKEGKKYDWVDNPVFSPDGKHIAYSAMKDGKHIVVIDGKESPKYEMYTTIHPVKFGPKDNRIAYAVMKGEKWVVVVNGKEGPEYDAIGGNGESITLSPDGKSFAYVANRGQKWFVVTNGKEGPEYDDILVRTPIFSPCGKHLIYGAREGEKWFVVLDGSVVSEKYDEIGYVQFSPDSKHFTFRAKKDNRWFVVLDGKEGPNYTNVFKPIFREEGVEYLAESSIPGWLLRCRLSYPKSDGKVEKSEERIGWLVESIVGKETKGCKPCERKKQEQQEKK